MKFDTLNIKLEEEILHLRFNRPGAFNAINMEMLQELHALFNTLDHPSSMHTPIPQGFPRVIVLGAEGRAFSAGVDVKAADRGIGGKPWNYKDMRSQQLLRNVIQRMRCLPQPFVAAIQGPAAGAGLALALACDVRVATRTASFSAAFVKLALTGTDMGTSFFLPRVAGLGIASEMLLTGRAISAERGYQVGMVNEMVDSKEDLEAAAHRFAKEMTRLSPLGLQLTKEQLHATSEGGSLSAAMTAENSHQMLLVNDARSAQVAQAWLDSLLGKSKQHTTETKHQKHSKL